MAAIDIGIVLSSITAGTVPGYTLLTKANPANGTGTLVTFKIYLSGTYGDGTSVKMGTFSGSGTTWTVRDYQSLGTVTSGSVQTFTGLDCSVSTNDILGAYVATTGRLAYIGTGGSNILYVSGDKFASGATVYAENAGWDYSLYAESTTGWTGKINGVTNPAKIWGVPVANIAKVVGI